MIPEIGSLCLYLSLAVSSLIFIRTVTYTNYTNLLYTKRLWLVNAGFIFLAGICLIYLFAVSDFSILSVANHSHTTKPLIYKISGAWGHHEGSMLLWLAAIAFFSVLFAYFANGEARSIELTSGIQALIAILFTSFTIFSSNPFTRIFPAPLNGLGLNPILQDIGLAMHPPMLYLGYVGFSIAFSAAIAVLAYKQNFKTWVNMIHPWILLSWSFLTLGVGLGSWWAYRELGWGGFWFWDPVENASLMPWLASTALIHALTASQKTGQLQKWSIFLAILTFALSMIGTFLVRSGIITSVHSFATDPTRGVYILAIIALLTVGALLLYASKAHSIGSSMKYNLISREAFIMLNNVVLCTAVTIVIVGTIYPFALEIFAHKQVSVGAPYYNKLISPLVLATLSLAVFGSSLPWRKVKKTSLRRPTFSFLLALLITLILWFFFGIPVSIAMCIICFSLWLFIAMINMWLKQRPKLSNPMVGMLITHIGFALVAFGISLNAALKEEVLGVLETGQNLHIREYTITLKGVTYAPVENYLSRTAKLEVSAPGKYIFTLYPETRLYPTEKQQTTESALHHHVFYDLYTTIGDLDSKGRLNIRVFFEPGVSFLWFGCLVMFFGGIYSMLIRLWYYNHKTRQQSVANFKV